MSFNRRRSPEQRDPFLAGSVPRSGSDRPAGSRDLLDLPCCAASREGSADSSANHRDDGAGGGADRGHAVA
jgi:hypothetical protein